MFILMAFAHLEWSGHDGCFGRDEQDPIVAASLKSVELLGDALVLVHPEPTSDCSCSASPSPSVSVSLARVALLGQAALDNLCQQRVARLRVVVEHPRDHAEKQAVHNQEQQEGGRQDADQPLADRRRQADRCARL